MDWSAAARGDARHVGELASEEPDSNADLLARLYIADDTRATCAPFRAEAFTPQRDATPHTETVADQILADDSGRTYTLTPVALSPGGQPELRWVQRTEPHGTDPAGVPITLRDLVGRLESYEPARSITSAAIAQHRRGGAVSTARLATELDRLLTSTIVLNRAVREAVKRDTADGQLTLSVIASRCGRVKHDHRGNSSGETSWLARRIGAKPEGNGRLTPWIHSDTLALIAREGLGRDPHELELH